MNKESFEFLKEALSADRSRGGDLPPSRAGHGVLEILEIYDTGGNITLQFWGYAVTLNTDGTWSWEDTSGG
jgi:hypothetical protein